MIRVVHYINQFFGGIGGEDKAHLSPRVTDGAVGPGRAIQAALGKEGQVLATVICGDNYFAENIAGASEEVIKMINSYDPDIVIAGPAFNAGRYGIACGAVCKAVQDQLKIPAVTGMYRENPGLDLYRQEIYILETRDSARTMSEAIAKMVGLAQKLAAREKVGSPSEEGYFPRGVLVNEISEKIGAERVVDMLLSKLRGEPFETEVARPTYDRVKPAPAIKDMRKAKIRTATRYGKYDIRNVETLDPANYEVSHEGYDSFLVRQDPNRLVPVDVMRELENEGVIGQLHDKFYSTTGVANIVMVMKSLGEKIAQELKVEEVSGVILTST
jgi:betaine reductase